MPPAPPPDSMSSASSAPEPAPTPPAPVSEAGPAPELSGPTLPSPPASARTQGKLKKSKKAPTPPKRVAVTPEMHEKLSALLIALLERDAQIRYLAQQVEEAIQETVRSTAKLASQESRAEAASTLAEAEVALKTLKASVKGLEQGPEYASVVRLLQASADELRKENYGGSLYLTNQVKERLRELRERIESEPPDKANGAAGGSVGSSEFDAKVARWQSLMSAKDADIRTLRRKLDEAVQEAVRAKSKLRSQESRAQAVSNLAEAETVLRAFASSARGRDALADVTHVQALLAMGAEELRKDNYSGSFYLTTRAKAVLKDIVAAAQGRERITLLEGEVPLAVPLPVKLAAGGQVHENPSADAPAAWSVERHSSAVVVSHKGSWLRVKGEGDRWGWLFYSLIAYP